MFDSKSLNTPSSSYQDEWLRQNARSTGYIKREPVQLKRSNHSFDFIKSPQPQKVLQNSIPQEVKKTSDIVEQARVEVHVITPEVQPVLVSRSIETTEKPKQTHKKISKHVPKILIGMASFIFLVGLYAAFIGFKADQTSQVQAAKLTKAANLSGGNSSSSNPAISTVKPSASDIANYVVAPTLPRYIIIPKLDVNARIKPLSVNNSDQLEAPNNVYDTGWYNASSLPGQPGAMLIDGHVSSWTAKGVFYGIKSLLPGDQIKVQRGDGQIFTYTVVKSQIYNASQVDMKAAITPVTSGKPGLNIMTCTGDVIAGTSEFNERIVVFASEN